MPSLKGNSKPFQNIFGNEIIMFLLSWRKKHSQHAFKVFYLTSPENAKKLGQIDLSSMFLVAWAPFRRDSTKVTPREERSCWAAFGSCWACGGTEGWRDCRVQRRARMEQKHGCGRAESHISGEGGIETLQRTGKDHAPQHPNPWNGCQQGLYI